MADREPGAGDDAAGTRADVLAVVLQALAATGTESLTVLRAVHGEDGTIEDFVVVADSGLTAELASAPSVGRTLRQLMPAALAETLVSRNRAVVEAGALTREDFVLGTDDAGGTAPPPSSRSVDGPAGTPSGTAAGTPVGAGADVADDADSALRVGEVLRIPVGDMVVVLWRDVTGVRAAQRELRASELRLQQQALEDPLTGLPNRRSFVQALHRAAARSRRTGQPFAVLVLDVDNFKVLNDSLGHPAGDQLLIQLARRMAVALRPSDTVARLGGDEFVVLAEDLRDATDARAVAGRIVDSASGRYDVGRLTTRVTLSIGLATSEPGPGDTEDAPPDSGEPGDVGAVLADADAALYEAKRRGRNRVEVFDPALRERMLHRLVMEHELHQAITGEQLLMHWQPIVPTADGRPAAVEALLRWQHPERGLLAAAEFLPVAGEVGLLSSLCFWSVAAAMEQAGRWGRSPGGPEVFINLGATELSRSALADELAGMAERFGVDPHRVHFELSEEVLRSDLSHVREQLEPMRAYGFRIALDDFGAGNSALTWLRQLPIDTLKLDRSLAATLHEAPTRAVVRSIVQLAAALGIRTVAEGVETAEQLAFFTEAGCDDTQGYVHARPGPPETVVPGDDATVVWPEGDLGA